MLENLAKVLDDYQKILFIGVGNVLKQDDGAGVYISDRINKTVHIQSLTVGQSFENYIGIIQKTEPDILIIIDCVDFNKLPGEAFLVQLEDLFDHTSNTHNISLETFSVFFNIPVMVLGIQPQMMDYGEGLSSLVQKTSEEIISMINKKA